MSALVLILGRRGSGKTRLLCSLSRLLEPGVYLSPCPVAYEVGWPSASVGAGEPARQALLCTLLELRAHPGAWVGVDDAELILDSYLNPRDPLACEVSLLRNRGINCVLITKAPMLMAAWVRAQADILVYRPWLEPAYARWLAAYGAPVEEPGPPGTFWAGPDPEGEYHRVSVEDPTKILDILGI